MRLNRYLASSGRCSRRHADDLIFSGRVKVNGLCTQSPGMQVREDDQVTLDGMRVIPFKEKHYAVMNKPPGVVTTMVDPQGRPTVRDLVRVALNFDHLKPIGRLDWNTCGVLLFTDDGDLHHGLTHPSRMILKKYEVTLSHPLPVMVLKKLRSGVHLHDGFLRPDFIDYKNSRSPNVLVIHLHSGKNRIIRRLMEKVGIEIKVLRRVSFAGISAPDLKEGDIRVLTPPEVGKLQRLIKNRVELPVPRKNSEEER